MSFNILETSNFRKEAKRLSRKHFSLKRDIASLIDKLEEDPIKGNPLGKNCYKIRLAIKSKGKGKSGGARVITCVKIVRKNLYLLTIYDKSDKENITNKELQELLKYVP